MPYFSIVIPAYNRADFLPQTLQSIQSQIFEDWECIVVDDGSKDHTAQVMQQISAQDARIRYVYQDNAERSAARNNGARHANGTYICFLDSDDAYEPNYLLELHQFLQVQNTPIALVVSAFQIWDGVHGIPQDLPPRAMPICEWLFTYPVSPSRACVHRKIFEKYTFREDIVIVEDSVLWASLATEFPVLFLNEPLVKYRVHEDNSVNRTSTAAFKRLDGLKKFFNDPLSSGISAPMRKHLLSDVRFRIAEYYSYHKQPGKVWIYALRSMATAPFHRHTKAKLFLMLTQFPAFERWWLKRSEQAELQ